MRYKRNYLRKLDEVDNQIKGIMDEITDSDEVILWSDHGSNYFNCSYSSELIPHDCPAKLDKIWKPTLLIKSEILKGLSSCDELVSTVDLYQIVLKLSGAKLTLPDDIDSNLPKILGGSRKRDVASTFSPSERKTKAESSKIFYLITRYTDNTIEIYKMDNLPNEETKSLKDHNRINYKQICKTKGLK